MNNLDLVSIAYPRLVPFDAPDNGAVEFHGDELRWQVKLINELCEIRCGFDTARLAVEMDIDHISIVNGTKWKTELAGSNDAAEFDLLARRNCTDKERGPAGVEFRHLKMHLCEPIRIGPCVKYHRAEA